MTTLSDLISAGFRSVAVDVTGVVIDANSKFAKKTDLDTVTSKVTNLENNKLDKTGTVDKAKKLATARNVKLSGGVVSSTKSFDGSGDLDIPVTEIKESFLT